MLGSAGQSKVWERKFLKKEVVCVTEAKGRNQQGESREETGLEGDNSTSRFESGGDSTSQWTLCNHPGHVLLGRRHRNLVTEVATGASYHQA